MGHFDLHLDDITFECWMNFDTPTTDVYWVSKSIATTAANRYGVGIFKNSRNIIVLHAVSGAHTLITSSNPIPTGWNHVAVVLKRGLATDFYINGELSSSHPSIPTHDFSSTYKFRVAGHGNATDTGLITTASFPGKLSEFRMWRRALTQQEIQDNMYTRLNGDEPNLVGYWPLDEIVDGQVLDKTANANHGTIVGSPTIVDVTGEIQEPPAA